MYAALAPLPKCFSAPIDFTLKWFLTSVGVVVLHQVLLESEVLVALVALPLLVDLMDLHMPLQGVLRFEDFATDQDVTSEPLFVLVIYLSHIFNYNYIIMGQIFKLLFPLNLLIKFLAIL